MNTLMQQNGHDITDDALSRLQTAFHNIKVQPKTERQASIRSYIDQAQCIDPATLSNENLSNLALQTAYVATWTHRHHRKYANKMVQTMVECACENGHLDAPLLDACALIANGNKPSKAPFFHDILENNAPHMLKNHSKASTPRFSKPVFC